MEFRVRRDEGGRCIAQERIAEVPKLVQVDGLSVRSIARRLCMARKTVRCIRSAETVADGQTQVVAGGVAVISPSDARRNTFSASCWATPGSATVAVQ